MADGRLGRDLVLLIVLQLVVLVAFRALLPADIGGNESTDFTQFYRPVADRLADGDGLEVAEDQPALRYPPGYPALLSAAFLIADVARVDREAAITPLTIALTVLAGVLLHLVARRLFDRRHAWATSVAWLAYPLTLWTTKQPNSEIPFLPLLYGAVLLLVPVLSSGSASGRRLLAAGALLGLATIVRPAGLLLLPAFALVVWLRLGGDAWRRSRSTGVFVASFALPVLLVIAWMSTTAHHPVLLTDANTDNLVEGLSLAADAPEEVEALPMPGGLRDLVLDVQAKERELLAPHAAREYLLTTARHRPVALGELVAYKAARSWYGTETFRFEGAIVAIQVVWVGLALAGARLALRLSIAARWFVWLVAAITLCSWAGTVAVLSIVRYLVPALGLFAPLVAVAVLALLDRGRRSHELVREDAASPSAT